MKYTRMKAGAAEGPEGWILVRLEVGDEIHACLRELVLKERLPSGSVTGLGAVSDVTLALYDPARRVYIETRLQGDLEIATLTGNISWLGEEPVVHLHGVVSRPDATAAGGHIMRGVVSVTLEVMIQVYPERVVRSLDPAVGLNLLDLS